MDGDGSEMGKGRPTLKATTIDEFLKENGITVDLDGLSTSETITEQHGDDAEDSMALYENYYQYMMAESEEEEGHANKKKTHGHTSCADIYGRTMEQQEEVTFDIGGPVGPTAQSVSNLTSFAGTIGRNKRFTIRDAWKRFKGKLKLKHFEPYDNFDDMVKNRPQRVPEDQFIKLLLYWSHPTIQAMCQRNKKNKEQQKFSHRMGPVNFARVRAAMEIFRSRQASGESEEEAFRSIFGKEQPGRVRCYGRSITQSDLQRHSEISALKQQHQEEVTTLKSELGDMKTQQQLQAEEIQGLRSMVKLLMLRSEPDMRPEEVDAMMQHGQHSPIDTNSGHGSHHIRNVSTISC
ncbi:hypothetical protein PIB30_084983 [Stylosanthes scabra]|uniref:Transposase, Ptta/En/Spm, plant n=1 Tax=Stylosanthes scabra TaxID=79078 RepID=A0ABU6YTA7_9FABA|nr:hypothetical protein [Stylosanthes scabra]